MPQVLSYLVCICLFGIINTATDFEQLEWWQTTLIYQIYPRSFKDSDGDGVGDINGITEKLDYVKDIGVETIWLQPFYKSPMVDMGYDVQDYREVDPLFGTLDDFKKLLEEVKKREMKIILDFVPNHSSDQCEWFKLSEQKVEPYTDYYVWKDAKVNEAGQSTYPNNWQSVFGGTAWQWSEKRKQYYLHQFAVQQPDLNYRNPKVIAEMNSVLRYWLDLGVDGFRVDAPKHMYEAAHFLDEPEVIGPGGYPIHIYMQRQPENVVLIQEWRALLDEYSKKDGQTRYMCIEDYDLPSNLIDYLGNASTPGAHTPFYFFLVFTSSARTNATSLDHRVHLATDAFPRSALNWVTENHDNQRIPSRFVQDSVDSWSMLTLLLPGVVSVYYGGEIGMEDIHLRPDQSQDSQNGGNGRTDTRDSYRAPMPWDDTKNAGFTTADKPWLPVHPSYWRSNVKSQAADPNSHLNIFKRLVELRKTPVIIHGDLQTYVAKTWVYMFTRSIEGETVAVLMNIGSETEEVCAKDVAPGLPDIMFVYSKSINSGLAIGDAVRISASEGAGCVEMRPQSGIVLTTNSAILTSYSVLILLLTTFVKVWC